MRSKRIDFIEGVRDGYVIYEDGRVWSDFKKGFLRLTIHCKGYHQAVLQVNGKPKRTGVHRLVMLAFNPIDNADEYQVNHIDGDKSNNHLSNLEWTTCKENIHHAMEHGLRGDFKGENNGQSVLTEADVRQIVELIKQKVSYSTIAKQFGVSKGTIAHIKTGRNWGWLTKDLFQEPSTTIENVAKEKDFGE